MSAYRMQLQPALDALTVTSPTTYDWFGQASRPLSRAVRAALTPAEAHDFLVARVAAELYRSFYVRGHAVRVDRDEAGAHADADHAFVQSLSEANSGAGGWEAGWKVAGRDGAQLVLARGRLRVRAAPEDCRPAGDAALDGEPVSVRRPKELRNISPGHYLALGDEERPPRPRSTELRVYFHVRAAGAAKLVAAATRACNAEAIPFELKVPADPGRFRRCDAAVLYLDDGDLPRVRPQVRREVGVVELHAAVDDRDDDPLAPRLRPCLAHPERRIGERPLVADQRVGRGDGGCSGGERQHHEDRREKRRPS
jgi:hypothetical protein